MYNNCTFSYWEREGHIFLLLFGVFAAINLSSHVSSLHHPWNDHINRLSTKTSSLKWSHKSSFNQNKPHQFTLHSSVLSNQANVLKQKFDQTWQIVYIFLDIFHLLYTFPWASCWKAYKCEILVVRPVFFSMHWKTFLSKTLGYKQRPPLGLKVHWTLALWFV